VTHAMRILVLGGTGLIGLGISTVFHSQNINFLSSVRAYHRLNFQWPTVVLDVTTSTTSEAIERLISENEVTHVINCIGLTKHRIAQGTDAEAEFLNVYFPSLVGLACLRRDVKLIHISTDCVYGDSSLDIMRSEQCQPSPSDSYGVQKLLGEVHSQGEIITIRTSTYGFERETAFGLLEWFLKSQISVSGYAEAYFSGISTQSLGKVILNILEGDHFHQRLLNISGDKIDKYTFLMLVKDVFDINTSVKKNTEVHINRCLSNEKMLELGLPPIASHEKQLMELRDLFSSYY
jgi:dTDP-4-dehydrorhamnose reductase